MRRFEYADEKSAKFWEIEQSDKDLHIRWGRIGSAGQRQVKGFADAGKAQAAMLKLVLEKTSKGYVEQASGAAGADAIVPAAPCASPAAPVTAPDAADKDAADAGLAPWLAQGEPLLLDSIPDKIRKLAQEAHRQPLPLAPIDFLAAWSQVRKLNTILEADIAGSDPRVRADFQAAWDSLKQPEPDGTLETFAILMALGHSRGGRRGWKANEGLVDCLAARHGLPHVVEVLLASMAYVVDGRALESGMEVALVRPCEAAETKERRYSLAENHWRLRAHLDAAPHDVHALCAAKARTAIEGLPGDCQVVLALLFPGILDVTHDTVKRLGAGDVTEHYGRRYLMVNAAGPAALAGGRLSEISDYCDFWRDREMIAAILFERGVHSVRWLAPGAGRDLPGEALTCIGTPEALEALARVAGKDRSARNRFELAAGRWPVAATVALARLLSGRCADADLLTPILVGLLRARPSLPADLEPWLEPAPNALLMALSARLAGPVAVAATGDLPDVLANVPWLRPKKKSLANLALPLLALPPVERWEDGKKDEIRGPDTPQTRRQVEKLRVPEVLVEDLNFSRDPECPQRWAALAAIAHGDADALVAAWRATLTDDDSRGYYAYFNAYAVTLLAPELGIPLWNAAAGEAPCRYIEHPALAWGMAALPGLVACIDKTPSEHFGMGLRLGAVGLAPVAARLNAKLKTLRHAGREWLQRYPEHAACGLIAPALGKPGEARECAVQALRYLAGIGHGALIEEVAARYGRPDVLPALHAVLEESPLDRYPAKRPTLPGFWDPSGWHRPVLHNGKALPDAALEALGTMMAFPRTEEVYAGLYQVKDACTARSLADFAWDCFSAWLNAGAPGKESWALASLGVFGTDDTARKLAPLVRAWPAEAAHARAAIGLDVLAAIGSDVALMLLNGIAQKSPFGALRHSAGEKIEAIAAARGLRTEELEDRLAPDLGLDAAGTMVLDFGPRAFRVGFDEALRPYVREWQDGKAGARLSDLPRPRKTDDKELATDAVERFKLLKQDARTVASQQVLRLEAAMCARRRWAPGVFAECIAQHPLLRHLARRLVWGVYAMPPEPAAGDAREEARLASHGGALEVCFRVAEDGGYTTHADEPFSLPEGAQYRIGLPHALELTAEQAAAFGQLLADYELLQPFPQLGRETYSLTEEERKTRRLLRWKGLVVPTGKVLGLAHAGWSRGPVRDGGMVWTYERPLDARRSAELDLDPGIIVSWVEHFPEQTLGAITLDEYGVPRDAAAPGFGALDPILASELIRDIERLRS